MKKALMILILGLAFALQARAQIEYIIQYDDDQTVYYSGRPRPDDTVGVWFEPPTDCQILAGQFQINAAMGGDAIVYVWDVAEGFNPDNYFDSDETGASPGPTPLGTVLAGPIYYTFDNSGNWQEIVFADYGYSPEDLNVGMNYFYLGYVLVGGQPQLYYPSLLGDAVDDRPYHSLAWLSNPAGLYPNWSGWWAYGIDWMLRARVLLTGDPPPEIEGVVDPPDTYIVGPYAISATITDMDSTQLPGSGHVAQARLIFSIAGASPDTVLMTNTSGDLYEGQIPGVSANQTINFRVEAEDDNGLTSLAPGLAGYNFAYRQPSGAAILLVNDAGNHDGESFYCDALEDAGYAYDFWYIAPGETGDMGYPGADVINADIYDCLLWFNGIAHSGSLPDNEADLTNDPVANFMDAGGNFFLSSSDYLGGAFNPEVWTEFTAIPGTFMYQYLKVVSGWSDAHLNMMTSESNDTLYTGVAGDPISGEYAASYFQNHPDPNYNDYCYPHPSASSCFLTQIDDEPAGIRYEGSYKMVFLPWALEACDQEAISSGILVKVLEYFGESATAPWDLTLIPIVSPIQIPATGGSFEFLLFLTNNTGEAQPATFWSLALMPNNNVLEPIVGPATAQVDTETTGWHRFQNVPAAAPAGMYTYIGCVGEYPNEIWASDLMIVEKLSSGEGLQVANWDNWGDPFVQGENTEIAVPEQYALRPAYPNPFNPTTTLSFDLPQSEHVTLSIFDPAGRCAALLVDGLRPAGTHEVTFDATALASGVYLYHLQAGTFRASGKMVMLK